MVRLATTSRPSFSARSRRRARRLRTTRARSRFPGTTPTPRPRSRSPRRPAGSSRRIRSIPRTRRRGAHAGDSRQGALQDEIPGVLRALPAQDVSSRKPSACERGTSERGVIHLRSEGRLRPSLRRRGNVHAFLDNLPRSCTMLHLRACPLSGVGIVKALRFEMRVTLPTGQCAGCSA